LTFGATVLALAATDRLVVSEVEGDHNPPLAVD
jgi:hypothetical protein